MAFLFCKDMFADGLDGGTAENPLAGGCLGVVIIDGSTGGVHAAEGHICRPVAALIHFCVDLSICHRSERQRLIHYPCDSVGEGWMLHTVEHDSAHGHLPQEGFPSCLAVNDTRQ